MDPLVITLKKKRKEGLFFYIDGLRHDDLLTHNDRVECLKKANKTFDHDFETVAMEFKDHQYGGYLWCFTSEFLRGEEITSLLRSHYLKEIFEKLVKYNDIEVLIIEAYIPINFRRYFKQFDLSIKYKTKSVLYSFLRKTAAGNVTLIKSVLKNIKFLFTSRNKNFSGVLADINRSFTKHRYDNIDRIIEFFPEIRFFSGQEHKIEGVPINDTIVFRKETNLKIVFTSIWESIKISLFILKNSKKIPVDLYNNLSGFFNLIMYVDLLLYENCVEKYLNRNKIRKVIHVSTLTRPTYRILMSLAKRKGIEFILVASRTLMSLRSSERVLSCDIKGINNAFLPVRFIFKDLYSTKIFDNYPEQQKKVFIGGRYLNNEIKEIEDKTSVALLILFNHTKNLSFKLLKEIDRINLPNNLKTIIYRCHPNYYIEKDIMQSFFPQKKIIDISGKDYLPLANYRTIAISGPTTGALEAIQAGAVILWAPYIWDDGILLDDMMSHVGVKCENIKKLTATINHLIISKEEFTQQLRSDTAYCNKYFNTTSLISEVLNEIN